MNSHQIFIGSIVASALAFSSPLAAHPQHDPDQEAAEASDANAENCHHDEDTDHAGHMDDADHNHGEEHNDDHNHNCDADESH